MKYSQQLFIFCKYGNILLFSTFNSYFYTQKNPRLELRAISTLQFLGLYFLLSNFICYQSDFSELTQHNQRNLSHIFRAAQAGICNPKKLQYRKISLKYEYSEAFVIWSFLSFKRGKPKLTFPSFPCSEQKYKEVN